MWSPTSTHLLNGYKDVGIFSECPSQRNDREIPFSCFISSFYHTGTISLVTLICGK